MRHFSGGSLGIDQGSVLLFSDFQDGGPMWTGSGPRLVRRALRFARPFLAEPAVIVGISMFDLDRMTNPRADLSAEGITPEGFELVFRTWGDSRVARIRADWTAIGPLPDPEAWDLD
jgi:hypothetical protein